MALTKDEMAALKVARDAAKNVGATLTVTSTHGGMKEILAVAPSGKLFRASGSAVLVAHHGVDFAYLCNDIAERISEGLGDGEDWTLDDEEEP